MNPTGRIIRDAQPGPKQRFPWDAQVKGWGGPGHAGGLESPRARLPDARTAHVPPETLPAAPRHSSSCPATAFVRPLIAFGSSGALPRAFQRWTPMQAAPLDAA